MDIKAIWNALRCGGVTVSCLFVAFLGGWDGLIYALVAFMAIDYVTGVLCAIADKKLSSEVGRKGIVKKLSIFLIIGVAHIVDGVLGNGGIVRTATIIFFLSNEGLSLLENACRIGLPVPPKLKEVLSQLHHGKKKREEHENGNHTQNESE